VFDANGSQIPGPDSNNIFGRKNFFYLLRDGRRRKKASMTVKSLIRDYGNGDLCAGNIFGKRVIFLAHPEYVKVVCTGHHSKFPKSIIYNRLKFILGEGLVTSGGDKWKAHRNMTNPGFHAENLKNMVESFNSQTKELLHIWNSVRDEETKTKGGCSQKLTETVNGSVRVDMNHFINSLTLAIICETGFSYKYDTYTNNSLNAAESISHQLNILLEEMNIRCVLHVFQTMKIIINFVHTSNHKDSPAIRQLAQVIP